MKFQIYTDGACKGNPGKGGFAYMVYDDTDQVWYEGHGTHEYTTNNQMELYAVIEALRVLKKNQRNFEVEIFSDSAYVVNCFLESWIDTWEKNGWKTKKREDVANKEFWMTLNELVKETNAVFVKVKRNNDKTKKVDQKAKWASKR